MLPTLLTVLSLAMTAMSSPLALEDTSLGHLVARSPKGSKSSGSKTSGSKVVKTGKKKFPTGAIVGIVIAVIIIIIIVLVFLYLRRRKAKQHKLTGGHHSAAPVGAPAPATTQGGYGQGAPPQNGAAAGYYGAK